MKKTILTLGAMFIMMFPFMTSCVEKNPSWTDTEESLIHQASGTPMRLWLIDNPEDSLFLRQPCVPLTAEDVRSATFRQLKERMLLTVTDPNNEGVGIAAPQVGIGRQMVAVQRFDKYGEPFEFYVNPYLVYLSDEQQKGWEGCLSIPGKRGEVMRSSRIVVEYNDPTTFELRCDTVEGFTAVIFQHETDHLDGTLYIDKLVD